MTHDDRHLPRRAERLFRDLLARSPRSAQLLAPDGRTLAVNRAWETLWGLSLGDLAGYDVLSDPQLREKGIAGYLERAFAGEAVEVPAVAYDLGFGPTAGETRWVRATATPVFGDGGSVELVVLVHEDVTDTMAANERLAHTQDLLEEAQQSARVGSWSWDLRTHELAWSAETYRLFGFHPGTAVTYERYLTAVHPDDRGPFVGTVERALRDGGSFETDHRVVRPDGSVRTVNARGRVVVDGLGEPIRMVGSGQDITDRLQAEEAERVRRERQARVAADIGTTLTAPLGLGTQLQRCAETLVLHLDAAFARVWTVDEDDPGTLVLRASAGLYTHLDGAHARVPVESLKIGRIAARRQPHVTNAVLADPEVGDRAWAEREGMVAFVGYPLVVGDRLLGVMAAFARQPFPDAVVTVLGGAADMIALGIERAAAEAAREALLESERLAREAAEATASTLAVLNAVGQVVAAELDLEKLVQAVTDAATELTGAQFGAFFYNVVSEDGESYTLYALSGVAREAFAAFPMPRSTAIFGPTFRGEGTVRLADVRRDARYGRNSPHAGLPTGHLPVVSYLAQPVTSRSGEVLGGLFFGHPEPDVFDERAEQLVAGLAAHAAVAIDNARLLRAAQGAERRYRGLFEGGADGILVADGARRYRDANAAAASLLGYSRDELLALGVEDVVLNERPWTEAEFGRFVAEGRWRGELELRRKDGTTVPVEASATAVDLPDGPVYLSVVRDVTERRAAQQQQQRFLEAVSHDLKNPLAVVLVNAQLLRRRIRRGAPPDGEKLEQAVTAVEAAAHRIERQLDEFEDVLRLRTGHPLELRTGPTDLVSLAREAAADARATAGGHTVRVDGDPPPLVGDWDAVRLRRVLDNLLGNAVKYSPGGGEITVAVGEGSRDGGRVAMLSVRDQGIGIPEADLPHVFDRYRRGSNVGTKTSGRGIGLAGVSQIVEQHGGTITIESTERRGTVVTVDLPLHPPSSERSAPPNTG